MPTITELDRKLETIFGEAMMDSDKPDADRLTVRTALIRGACVDISEPGKAPDAVRRMEMWDIAKRLKDANGSIDLKPKDVVKLQEGCNIASSPMLYGILSDILESNTDADEPGD